MDISLPAGFNPGGIWTDAKVTVDRVLKQMIDTVEATSLTERSDLRRTQTALELISNFVTEETEMNENVWALVVQYTKCFLGWLLSEEQGYPSYILRHKKTCGPGRNKSGSKAL